MDCKTCKELRRENEEDKEISILPEVFLIAQRRLINFALIELIAIVGLTVALCFAITE